MGATQHPPATGNHLAHCNYFNKAVIPFDHLPGSYVEYRELNNRLRDKILEVSLDTHIPTNTKEEEKEA